MFFKRTKSVDFPHNFFTKFKFNLVYLLELLQAPGAGRVRVEPLRHDDVLPPHLVLGAAGLEAEGAVVPGHLRLGGPLGIIPGTAAGAEGEASAEAEEVPAAAEEEDGQCGGGGQHGGEEIVISFPEIQAKIEIAFSRGGLKGKKKLGQEYSKKGSQK